VVFAVLAASEANGVAAVTSDVKTGPSLSQLERCFAVQSGNAPPRMGEVHMIPTATASNMRIESKAIQQLLALLAVEVRDHKARDRPSDHSPGWWLERLLPLTKLRN
jgi:hypothetical protein